ncbi:unnamed protein product [Leptosia nina]|uniref:Uncharacterized protein n=1 Tax=Leptosia nina TaxID=320188 RepID=A0AAV1IT44_9NEOP
MLSIDPVCCSAESTHLLWGWLPAEPPPGEGSPGAAPPADKAEKARKKQGRSYMLLRLDFLQLSLFSLPLLLAELPLHQPPTQVADSVASPGQTGFAAKLAWYETFDAY